MRSTPADGEREPARDHLRGRLRRLRPGEARPSATRAATQIDPTDRDCVNPAPSIQTCCELQKLAVAGGGHRERTPTSPTTRRSSRSALAAILSQIVGSATARTTPVYSPAPPFAAQGTASTPRRTARVVVPVRARRSTSPRRPARARWRRAAPGHLDGRPGARALRRAARGGRPTPLAASIDQTAGDDYALQHRLPGQAAPVLHRHRRERRQPAPAINSDWTIRPYIAGVTDGFGTYMPDPTTPTALISDATFPDRHAGVAQRLRGPAAERPALRRRLRLREPRRPVRQRAPDVGDRRHQHPHARLHPRRLARSSPRTARPSTARRSTRTPGERLPVPQAGRDLPLHAGRRGPAARAPPRRHRTSPTPTRPSVATQPDMLYTASIDGQLHAFKVSASVNTDTMLTTDTGAQQRALVVLPAGGARSTSCPTSTAAAPNLLDGAPVVADVPGAVVPSARRRSSSARRRRRPVQWHRVLVSSGGAGGGFYYALDITDPRRRRSSSGRSPRTGPATRSSASPRPRRRSPSSRINEAGVTTQVPVAILPGGSGALALRRRAR